MTVSDLILELSNVRERYENGGLGAVLSNFWR